MKGFTLALTVNKEVRLWHVHFPLCWPWIRALIYYHLKHRLSMFLFYGEVIFCSRYSSFSIFNYPMVYQICDVMMGISTWDSVQFSVSHPEEIWEHRFQKVSWMVLLIWHYNNIYSGLKCVLFICKLENYKKDSLLIIFGWHF